MRRLALACVLATACGPTGDDEARLRGYEPRLDMALAPDAALPDAGPSADTGRPRPVGLDGTYAVLARIHAKVIVDLYLQQSFLLSLRREGDEVHQVVTTCGIDLPSFQRVVTLAFPPPVLDLLRERPAVSAGDFLTGDGPGAAWRPAPVVSTLGVDVAGVDPATVTLPTQAEPARAKDEDADGQPGVTVEVTAATCTEPQQLYVAFRTTAAFDGVFADLDTLSGTVTPTLEQQVLGMSHDCLRVATTLVIDVQDDSTFRGRRVDDRDADGDGEVTCAELDGRWADLFPPE